MKTETVGTVKSIQIPYEWYGLLAMNKKRIAMQQDDNKMPKTDNNKREKQAPQPEEQQNKRVEEKPELTTLNNPKISGGTSDQGSRDNTNDTIGNP